MSSAPPTCSPTLTDILFERSADGLCLVAPDGAVLRANAEWLRWAGFSAERAVGENIIDLFPATRDMALAMHARARAGHRVEVPRHAQTVNGRETWWEGSIEPVPMEGGTGLLITAREVQPERQDVVAQLRDANAKLAQLGRASEAHHRLALEAARFGTFEFIPATGELRWDRQMKRLWGLPPDDDLDYARAMERIHPEDRSRVDRAVQGSLDPTSMGEYRVEYRLVWPDGSVHWIDARGKVEFEGVAAERRPVKMIGVEVDITGRKRAEEALRATERRLGLAFDAGRAAAWEVDLVAGTHVWEDRFFPLLCVPPERREWAEQHWTEFVLPEDRERAAQEFAAACEEGNGVYDSQFRARRMDGVVRWYRSRGVEVREPGGGRRMVGFVQDITEQKQAEETLLQANEKLREADRRKDEFLGMLSHELRNPLAPIRNATYILQRAAPGSEQARRAQSVIHRQSEHLTRLVDDLLDVTRIVRGKIELCPARADLREVIGRAADDYRWMMRDRGVKFDVVLPSRHVWADADATRITQIVGNLLHNAAKFTATGDDVVLTLDADDAEATIRVRDTGRGIDAELLPRIFEAFVQGERTLARTDGGLGLGLALVKGIAELHGGKVEARSDGRRKGAEFTVHLPLVATVQAERTAGSSRRASHGGRRILVVDDNRDAAESLADVIRMLGHSVELAYDGPSAIDVAKATRPDVVLCDIGLPGMSGYEVAQALRADPGNGMQLFAVSGYAQPDDVRRAIEAGFEGHIAKPCDPEKIERLLNE